MTYLGFFETHPGTLQPAWQPTTLGSVGVVEAPHWVFFVGCAASVITALIVLSKR